MVPDEAGHPRARLYTGWPSLHLPPVVTQGTRVTDHGTEGLGLGPLSADAIIGPKPPPLPQPALCGTATPSQCISYSSMEERKR